MDTTLPPVAPVTGRVVLRVKMPQKLRNLELVLLVVSLGLSALALALVQWGALGTLDWSLLTYAAGLAGLTLGLHLVLRLVARDADPFIVPIATMLNGLGITMIHRLDIAAGASGWEAAGVRQMAWTAVALVIAIIVLILVKNYRVLLRYRYLAMLAGVILLTMPLWPAIGRTVNGATLWVNIGGMNFQPGEIAKIALAIFFAGYLVSRQAQLSEIGSRVLGVRLPRAKDLGPILLFWIASLGVLVIQRDLGTSILYFGLFLVMIYTATGRGFYVGIGIVMMVTGALVASRLFDYVERRFDSWLDPLSQSNYEAVGGSYQLVQGLFGMANGDVIGAGLGGGYPQFIPLAESDFVFAALGEELGLAGVFAILSIFLLIVYRGLRISNSHPDDFSKLLAMGLSFVIALQVFVVAGGVMGMLPLTGLTTPFLAAGGSSLLANWTIIALLLITSHSSLKRPSA